MKIYFNKKSSNIILIIGIIGILISLISILTMPTIKEGKIANIFQSVGFGFMGIVAVLASISMRKRVLYEITDNELLINKGILNRNRIKLISGKTQVKSIANGISVFGEDNVWYNIDYTGLSKDDVDRIENELGKYKISGV